MILKTFDIENFRGIAKLTLELDRTTVLIGENWLRMPWGASGFMSHMSCCGGPPQRKIKMHESADALRGTCDQRDPWHLFSP